jgi:hypothetical protein
MGFDPAVMSQFTRWVQIHPFAGMDARYQDPNYLEWLKAIDIPVYMEKRLPVECPASVEYPYAAVCEAIGSNYFAVNTFGYMIGLAILEGFKEIRLYGVNMGDGDLGDRYARPCIEFLLGFAAGRGIKVWVPESSGLLKANLYAQTVRVPSQGLFALMNGLRNYVERMPFGLDRIWLNQAVTETEAFYLEQVRDKARYDTADIGELTS